MLHAIYVGDQRSVLADGYALPRERIVRWKIKYYPPVGPTGLSSPKDLCLFYKKSAIDHGIEKKQIVIKDSFSYKFHYNF